MNTIWIQKILANIFSILPSKFQFSPQSFNFTLKIAIFHFRCSISANFRRYRFVLMHNQGEGVTSSTAEYEHYLDPKNFAEIFFNFTSKFAIYLKVSFLTFGCSISANFRRYRFVLVHNQGEGVTSSIGDFEPYLEPKNFAKKKACPEAGRKFFEKKKPLREERLNAPRKEKFLRGRPAVFAGEKKTTPRGGRLLPVWEN